MSIVKMAWRNVWRNKRRSLVTIAAMAFALLVTILYSGLATGMLRGLERNVVQLELGDIQVFAEGYRDKPQIYTRMEESGALVKKLRAGGFSASPRLLAAGLAAARDQSAGVQFRGVEVEGDDSVTEVQTKLKDGAWLDVKEQRGVVVGRRLAKTLNVKVGDELVVLAQASDGSMANELYRVRGVLGSVNVAVDRMGVFLNAAAFRELMAMPEGAHQIMVRKPATLPLPAAVALAIKLAPGKDVQSWKALMPTIASMLENSQAMLYTMFFIIYIAIGLVILNAMLMAVFERIREFGVLKALGMGPMTVFRLVIAECVVQVVLALAVGIGLGMPGVWYLKEYGIDLGGMGGLEVHGIAWDMVWWAEFSAAAFTGPIMIMLTVVFLAVLYPALKAALIRPVAAIQYR